MSEPFVEIEITYFAEFKVLDLWPDGDAPEKITAEAVKALVEKEHPRRIADDWFFPQPEVHIRVVDWPDIDSSTVLLHGF